MTHKKSKKKRSQMIQYLLERGHTHYLGLPLNFLLNEEIISRYKQVKYLEEKRNK